MSRFFNWKRFILCFMFLEIALLTAGCSAAWLGAVSNLMPALESAVSIIISFVAALEGKTVSASVVSTIQKIGSDIAAEITQVQALIADFKANASTGYLSQINAVLQGIVQNLGQILSAANVTDQTTVAKLTQLVGLAVAAVQAILALIPVATALMDSHPSLAKMKEEDKVATQVVNNAHNALKETYVAIRAAKTTNTVVNEALDSLPASLA